MSPSLTWWKQRFVPEKQREWSRECNWCQKNIFPRVKKMQHAKILCACVCACVGGGVSSWFAKHLFCNTTATLSATALLRAQNDEKLQRIFVPQLKRYRCVNKQDIAFPFSEDAHIERFCEDTRCQNIHHLLKQLSIFWKATMSCNEKTNRCLLSPLHGEEQHNLAWLSQTPVDQVIEFTSYLVTSDASLLSKREIGCIAKAKFPQDTVGAFVNSWILENEREFRLFVSGVWERGCRKRFGFWPSEFIPKMLHDLQAWTGNEPSSDTHAGDACVRKYRTSTEVTMCHSRNAQNVDKCVKIMESHTRVSLRKCMLSSESCFWGQPLCETLALPPTQVVPKHRW